MFENAILVLRIAENIGGVTEEAINAYRVESGVFNHVGSIPAGASDIIMDWIAKQGYTRAVAFEGDAISGLYAKVQAQEA